MCLLAISLTKKPSLDILRRAWCANSDGAGVAWVNSKKKVEYIKGISSVEELYNITQAAELPFVFHLRLQSFGGFDKLLTHPFEITKESKLEFYGECDRALFHNGTEKSYKWAMSAAGIENTKDKDGKEEPLSDTRAIAMILAGHKNNNFLHDASGKFVVVGPKHPNDEHFIRYYGDFDEEDGIFYSNLLWKYRTDFYNGHGSGNHGHNHHGQHHNSNVQKHKNPQETVNIGGEVYNLDDFQDAGFEAIAQQYALKKKDEKLGLNTFKPHAFFNKADRLDYRRWWKNYAPLAAPISKYPAELPPNTVVTPTDVMKLKLLPPPQRQNQGTRYFSQAEEEQQFFGGGCGREAFA